MSEFLQSIQKYLSENISMSGMRFLLKDDAFMGKIVYSNQLLDLRREDKYIHCQEWRLTYDFCNTFPPADSEMNTA